MGRPPLFLAAQWPPDAMTMDVLLHSGADPDARVQGGERDGMTSLMIIAALGDLRAAQILLDAGADVNVSKGSMTALERAAWFGHTKIVKILLQAGADVNAGHGSALWSAAEGDCIDVVKILLNAGADVNAVNENGDSALMLAVKERHAAIVKLLLEAGADVTVRNKNGDTALILARGWDHTRIIDLIREAGTDANIETIEWQVDRNGFRQFYTNDALHIDSWFVYVIDDSNQSQMDVVETKVNRISGYKGASFGIVFCYQDSANFYKLRINTKGRYKISKYVKGRQSTLVNWTSSENLNRGYNVINTLKVVYVGNHSFEYYLNDTKEGAFSDPSFVGGYSGYYAWISENDMLPDDPVDLRYVQLQPTHDP